MLNFENLVNEVMNEITALAREKLGGLVNEAKEDARSFLKGTEEDFKRWFTLLKDGKLTRDDFIWLSKSKKDLIEMFALKQAGLSQVKMQQFANNLLDILLGSAFKLLA
jgi:hypothetical protein